MTPISSTIPLTLGLVAGGLFVAVFIGATVLTMRNRRIIRRHSRRAGDE